MRAAAVVLPLDDRRERAERRVAAGAERARERALGGQAGQRVGVADRRSASQARASSQRACSASVPCPGAGTNRAASSTAPIACSRPSRCSPARASTIASSSPSAELGQARVDVAAQRDQLQVLARGEQLRRSAQAARADARAERAARPGSAAPHSASSAPARGGAATSCRPSTRSPGTSLAECTASVDLAAQQRRLEL